MRPSLALVLPALLALGAVPLQAQYQNHAQLSQSVQQLANSNRARTALVTIATSPGGRAIQALRVGPADRPALLVVAGAHGPQLVGSNIALSAARALLARAGDSVTVWFIPRLNPDAAEAMFASVAWERTANDTPGVDDDHDQKVDEDGVDDLNGDGVITEMLLEDPSGTLVADSLDGRLFRRASADHGEVGRYRLVSEGRDNDGDDAYNEDGPGGTDVNRNFSYDYAHHGAEAGLDPFSTPEAKGLAEFLMAHEEIAAVYVIGPQDNLLKPWENKPNQGVQRPDGTRAQEGTSQGGPLNSIMRQDQAVFADVGRRFREQTGLEKGPASAGLAGDVLSWAYYHFGRWSFGSRGWWVPDAPKDTSKSAPKSGGGTDSNADARNALKWFDANAIAAFVPWTDVTGIDNDGRSVRVGGFKPGALLNPPAGAQLDSTLARQDRFIMELAGMLPQLALRDVKATKLGDGVYRIDAEVINTGHLPSTTAIGSRLRNPRRVLLKLELGQATLLSGDAIQQVGPLPGGGGKGTSVSWTIAARAGSSVSVSAGSPVTGSATQSVTLR
ncbi:MAG TPA: M14 family zinc carboxypeptidase [Gemmatimonadales bacterium]|nr:M14 family zinc carboxypeptidase [Gemmatimonadales bacterium]